MFKKLLFTGTLFIAFTNAYAQSSAPFGITGDIAPPVPVVTIATNGRAVISNTATATLRGSAPFLGNNSLYAYPAQILSYSITFSAPSKIALSFTDNNSGKVLSFDNSDSTRFGVINGTTASGSLAVTLTNTLIDGNPVSVFLSAANGSTAWSATTVGGKPSTGASAGTSGVAPNYTTGFSKTAGATVPDSLTTLSGNLSMVLYVGKSLVDNATTTLTPTSSGTFTVVYL